MQTSATVNSQASISVALETSEDIDAMLASFAPEATSGTAEKNEQRKAPRFRVKWKAGIVIDGQCVYHGFVNDISTSGASIYLDSNLDIAKCTLYIHVPPLNLLSMPQIMEISGRILYVVHDADQQLFRAAIKFQESNLSCLGERLNKHHSQIPDSTLFC